MKTFTATHLNKHAQEVFDEVKEYESVVIEHDRYRGGVFAIVWNPDMSEEEVLQQMKDLDNKKSSDKSINEHLLYHEGDIAYGINDFGDLLPAFIHTIGRQPSKNN